LEFLNDGGGFLDAQTLVHVVNGVCQPIVPVLQVFQGQRHGPDQGVALSFVHGVCPPKWQR
jgi:hypothetical protein